MTDPEDRIDWLAVVGVIVALGIFTVWTWAITGGW